VPQYSSEAVVLRKANFGEADQVVTLLTRYKGKIASVAKGIRKISSRKGGNLDLLNHVKVQLYQGRGMDIITEVELISAYPGIKEDLDKVALAYLVAELDNEFLAEHQENKEVFDLTIKTLQLLEESSQGELVLFSFQVKLLSLLGFQPHLESCVRCGKPLPLEGLALSAELGGVIGPEEREMDLASFGVSAEVVKAWRFFLVEDIRDSVKLRLKTEVASDVGRSLQYYLEYILDKELKSPKLLTGLRKLNG
jgi:DNA repair protein RecO (recombination protein O)